MPGVVLPSVWSQAVWARNALHHLCNQYTKAVHLDTHLNSNKCLTNQAAQQCIAGLLCMLHHHHKHMDGRWMLLCHLSGHRLCGQECNTILQQRTHKTTSPLHGIFIPAAYQVCPHTCQTNQADQRYIAGLQCKLHHHHKHTDRCWKVLRRLSGHRLYGAGMLVHCLKLRK